MNPIKLTKPIHRVFIIIAALLVTLTGCVKQGEIDSSNSDSALSSISEVSSVFNESEFLDEYVRTSYDLCRTPFDSPDKLGGAAVLEFCYKMMVRNGEVFEAAPNDSYESDCCYVPTKMLTEYAEHYFGRDDFSYTKYYAYDEQKDAYKMVKQLNVLMYDSSAGMSITNTDVKPKQIIVTVEFAEDGFAVVDYVYTFIRDGENIHFGSIKSTDASSGKRKFFSDNAILIDELMDFSYPNSQIYSTISVADNRILLFGADYGDTQTTKIGYFNVNTMKTEKSVIIDEEGTVDSYPDVTVVNLEDKILYYDTKLNKTGEINLPADKNDGSFGHSTSVGSPNGKYIAYSDEFGVNLYNVEKGESKLLFEHKNPKPKNEVETEQYGIDGFSQDCTKLICQLYGYEWVSGYRIYDITDGTYVDISTNSYSITDLYNGKLITYENVYTDNEKKVIKEYKLHQYDVNDESAIEHIIPTQMMSDNYKYSNGFIFVSTNEQFKELPLRRTTVLQYNISKGEMSTLSEEITDTHPRLDVLAITDTGKKLVEYGVALHGGYAILK